MKIKVLKLNENAILPTYGSASAAGADLYNLPGEDVTVPPHETVMIHTGLAMELPEGYAGFLFARSGIASKRGLAPANKVGVIDSDYRGEFMVALHNHSDIPATVAGGERIAQLCILPVVQGEFILAEALDETQRGAGGFGSTGKK
ncbi:MAG: dUTP diphosphatase [Clostridia bacterium]|nr:dUTP diphosphatase [Clostridia bacterium]